MLLFRFLSPSSLLIFNLTSGTETFASVDDTTDDDLPKEMLIVVFVNTSLELSSAFFVVVGDVVDEEGVLGFVVT